MHLFIIVKASIHAHHTPNAVILLETGSVSDIFLISIANRLGWHKLCLRQGAQHIEQSGLPAIGQR